MVLNQEESVYIINSIIISLRLYVFAESCGLQPTCKQGLAGQIILLMAHCLIHASGTRLPVTYFS